MAWFSGRVSLGNFPDLAGAVNKISESVKNIEKNFDNALGFEEKPSESSSNEESGIWPAASDTKALFNPVMAFMGQREDESPGEPSSQSGSPSHLAKIEEKKGETPGHLSKVEEKKDDSPGHLSKDEEKEGGSPSHPSIVEEKEWVEHDKLSDGGVEKSLHVEEKIRDLKLERDVEVPNIDSVTQRDSVSPDTEEMKSESLPPDAEPQAHIVEVLAEASDVQPKDSLEVEPLESSLSLEAESGAAKAKQVESTPSGFAESRTDVHMHDGDITLAEEEAENKSPDQPEAIDGIAIESEPSVSPKVSTELTETAQMIETVAEVSSGRSSSAVALEDLSEKVSHEIDRVEKTVEVIQLSTENNAGSKEQSMPSVFKSDSLDVQELEKVKKEMKMMETALQGAARQAQAKADEIARLMNENEQLKSVIEDLKRKSNDAEIESLREEYHQRVATLERKVYALTKERDTLRREQSKKSDAAALLKEKDEIINQVMAEGEELSKKQAAQESTIRKLRAQIRELEEEKKGLTTKLQVEENKVESIKRDKAATEKLLQETIEKHQTELSAQKEYYTSALTAAKEAEALAEARANSEARTELESRLREAEDREAMLVQTLQELRQTLSRKEQQAVFNEDRLRWEIEDLQKRYQESERRCEELISQVPESTRPLLRQIEAIQEAASRKAEAWAAVERSLNSRLQEAEAKAAAAEERERSINDRLSQTLSRVNVLEAQISCLRAEQTQLSRSLEKERQRAAENRQEYLAAKEEADTHEGRANQLEEELKELKRKHKQELQEALMHRELLQQEIEREKTARLELERTAPIPSTASSDQTTNHGLENGNLTRKLSSTNSLGSIEESFFLQASLNSSESLSERRSPSAGNMSPFYMKSMTPSVLEATLRQKEGELASYMSRLASMESIRDSLAEELVKMTAQCEKLKSEASMVPGIRAELEALRRRHSAALELMGERDEELEELRADIVDLKEMYREQVNLLVNQIQTMSASMGSS